MIGIQVIADYDKDDDKPPAIHQSDGQYTDTTSKPEVGQLGVVTKCKDTHKTKHLREEEKKR